MSFRLNYDEEPFLGGPLPGKDVLALTRHMVDNHRQLWKQINGLPVSKYNPAPTTPDNTYERVVERGGKDPARLLDAIADFEETQRRSRSRDELVLIACQLIRYSPYFISKWFTDEQLAAAVAQLKADLPDVWERLVNRQGEAMNAFEVPLDEKRQWDLDYLRKKRAVEAMDLDFGNDSRSLSRQSKITDAFANAAVEAAMQKYGVTRK